MTISGFCPDFLSNTYLDSLSIEKFIPIIKILLFCSYACSRSVFNAQGVTSDYANATGFESSSIL